MPLSKAIEILELNIKVAGPKMPPDTLHALKLMVEAGKRIRHLRQYPGETARPFLPGEKQE